MTTAERVARNIIANHGAEALRYLLHGLERNHQRPAMAKHLGVSNQRVHQWAAQLGYEVRTYTVDPGVQEIANATRNRSAQQG